MTPTEFIARWKDSSGAERANKDSFLKELCQLLGVPQPDVVTGDPERDRYVFEKDAVLVHEGKKSSTGKIDLYRHGCFLLEAKQGSDTGSKKHGTARRNTPAWALAMKDAYGQAYGYAQTLDEPPPFLIVTDIGYCFELYAVFDGSLNYRPYPNAQSNRIFLSDLEKDPRHLETLKKIWLDPQALDLSKVAARVTRDVATKLAELAKSLERSGRAPDAVATFLMRCLFTMFAEDVGLLPDQMFQKAIREHWLKNPASFPQQIQVLWRAMDAGEHFGLEGRLLKFNGGLFRQPESLPLDKEQLKLLLEAAECNWSDVEPAIFGTLLERALDPKERHKLGAHFTPRAYVERLVRPTIEEPLRAEWDVVKAEVRRLVGERKEKAGEGSEPGAKKGRAKKGGAAAEQKALEEARKAVYAFHRKLCATTVLDPACGSGNFLYVTLDLFKRLESEVFALLADLGDTQIRLDVNGVTVTPAQFHGIEIKRWAKEIAELVLWIGFLQHHARTRRNADGTVLWPEPVLKDLHNIECRDAVLAWEGEPEIVRDEATGKPVTRWDGESYKKSPVTGEDVPDESKRVPVYRYKNPRKAEWPKADYVVGNPPFIGNKRMRLALGDGYVEALRKAHNDVPETSDLVMYWWNQAAWKLRRGEIKRFGLITTNSITQTFNRKVVQGHLEAKDGVSLVFAIPDHPWVENSDGAAVRIAMTVGASDSPFGRLLASASETEKSDEGTLVTFRQSDGHVHADLTVGANVAAAASLRANGGLSFMGMIPLGMGFRLDDAALRRLGYHRDSLPPVIRRYLNGRDITQTNSNQLVIDLFGFDESQVQREYPAVYQWLVDHVRGERLQNQRQAYRERWWLFAESRVAMRAALRGLARYVGTPETAKHRFFVFIDAGVVPDQKVRVVASSDAFALGVLSSRAHVVWALAAGGWLGVGNDPVWTNTTCFDPFPFPDCSDSLRARIRDLGERLDAHRKRQQAQHPDLTITGMYNVLAKLRANEPLTDKDRVIHEQGLVTVLRQLHDDLDAAVFAAYDWPADLTDEQILERLVALNARRAEEERNGLIRWLRPEFQNPAGRPTASQPGLSVEPDAEPDEAAATAATTATAASPWPRKLADQIAAVRDLIARGTRAWTVEQVAASFKAARRDEVEDVLESLAALGLVLEVQESGGRWWRGTGRVAA